MNRPLKEHYENETDLGSTLATFDYIRDLEAYCDDIKSLVNKQAEDDGLWFTVNRTASEGYLQQELRKLHELIEKL